MTYVGSSGGGRGIVVESPARAGHEGAVWDGGAARLEPPPAPGAHPARASRDATPVRRAGLSPLPHGAALIDLRPRAVGKEPPQPPCRYSPESFVGRSASSRRIRELLARLAGVPLSALVISGETGTGKGLVARILHHGGPRAKGPLVEVNCAALPRELLESELFGHEAGAYTGAGGRYRGLMEQADHGTLFLDEIGEMPPDVQAKLLTAIEDRAIRRLAGDRMIPIDVQILAATNRDLERRVAEGAFRAELYHRLSVVRLALPPLRDRKEDLEDLVPLYIGEYNVAAGKRVRTVPEAAWAALRRHDWPGNVRELRNVIERCVLLSSGPVLPVEWLQLAPVRTTREASEPGVEGDTIRLPLDGSMCLEDMDRLIIEAALRRHGYNVAAAGRALGTTRNTLRYRIRKYGLHPS